MSRPCVSLSGVYPPTGVIAQRINVYRGMGGYKPAVSQGDGAHGDPDVRPSVCVFVCVSAASVCGRL